MTEYDQTSAEGIKIYSTLTRQLEEFRPLNDGEVKMYACGITVYDEAHLGHGRQAIVFDVIRRYLEFCGFRVNYVRNFTDVDDKIIARANERGIPAAELSAAYIDSTIADLKALKVEPASHEPRVTQHIPDIIKFISGLIEKGAAYVFKGDVLFDVSKDSDYGKLSNRSLEDCLNADESAGKRNPQDFALWKAAKPGEPSWESPWGPGRPGWHIECSVMARHYLGDRLDIHGGGVDLVFPHHENEIAQSEAYTGEKFANYWIHNGLVNVNGQKMSKSLGNMVNIKDAVAEHHPDVIRYAVLSHTYAAPIDFSAALFASAAKRVYYYYRTLARLDELLASAPDVSPSKEGAAFGKRLMSGFMHAMNDNFNSAAALAELPGVFTKINEVLDSRQSAEQKSAFLKPVQERLKRVFQVLRILDEDPKQTVEKFREAFLRKNNISAAEIEAAIAERSEAKKNKDYQTADRIRNELLQRGIAIQDKAQGQTTWDISLD